MGKYKAVDDLYNDSFKNDSVGSPTADFENEMNKIRSKRPNSREIMEDDPSIGLRETYGHTDIGKQDGDYFDEFDALDDAYNYQFKSSLMRGLDSALMESYKTEDYYNYDEPDYSGPNRKWLVGGMMSHEISDDDFDNNDF